MFLDYILIFIIVLAVFIGYRKGMSQMIITCIVFLFSIAIVAGIYNQLGNAFFESDYGLQKTDELSTAISERLYNFEDKALENAPYLSVLGISKSESSPSLIDIDGISLKIAKKALKTVFSIPLLLLSFFILKLTVFLLKKIVKRASRLPVLHGIDSLLGSLCGLFISIILVALSIFALGYLQFIPSLSFMAQQFDSSIVVLIINDFIF